MIITALSLKGLKLYELFVFRSSIFDLRSSVFDLRSSVFGLRFVDTRCLLEEIITRDSLTISEVELFKAVDLWASEECERKGLSVKEGFWERI